MYENKDVLLRKKNLNERRILKNEKRISETFEIQSKNPYVLKHTANQLNEERKSFMCAQKHKDKKKSNNKEFILRIFEKIFFFYGKAFNHIKKELTLIFLTIFRLSFFTSIVTFTFSP